MKINLSKKKQIIVIIILVVVLGGSGGYLLWRVNQQKTVAPTDSDASNCVPVGTETCKEYEGSCDEARHLKGCGSGLPAPKEGYSWCQTYELQCTSVCGDGTCSDDETATSCPADCACKAFTWSSKPSGSYKQSEFNRAATITNPNSSSTAETGISIKLNGTALVNCDSSTGVACYSISTSSGKQQITLNMVGGQQYLSAGSYTLSVTLPGGKDTCSESTSFTITDNATCGDNVCDDGESSSCPADCTCKTMTWSNKPSGTYKPTSKIASPISIVNFNSMSDSTTGVSIKLNATVIPLCSDPNSSGTNCYTSQVNSNGYQLLNIQLFGDSTSIPVGSYRLIVTVPGDSQSCATSASFVVATGDVPDTGIFDGVMGKVYLGTGFVFLGILTTQVPKFNYVLNTLEERNRVVCEIRRKKREEGRRNSFEKRFK